ncbi:MAG TPA: CpsD/CapB family tyrosine-protein kinase [Limnochordia bacterium]
MIDDPHSPAAEAFRSLRTNLEFAFVAQPQAPVETPGAQAFLITSAAPDEGKSTVTANLAAAYALTGARTLAICADLRRPTLHMWFDAPGAPGLTNLLVGQAALDEATQPTRVAGLDLLPPGPVPPNPAELLGSGAMERLLETLRARYEVILIDSPPAPVVTDAALLAPRVDGVLLVVAAGKTRRELARVARDQLVRARSRLLGVVINRAPVIPDYEAYYGYSTAEEQVPVRANGRADGVRPGWRQR